VENIMISRRRFLQSSATLALVPLLPRVALSADLRIRPSWDTFCKGSSFDAYVNAVHLMRANKNEADPASWAYWANTHQQYCPHGKPYFLAWHRGFVYRFEGWLRKVSGDSTMVVPYWDYYTSPQVPPEFLDTTSALYRKGRTGEDVSGALSLAPFDDSVVNFQRGQTNAFEPSLESQPHNPVHNLIGGAMSSILISPWDPLFWVHHANIDRLWAAWVAAGNGRQMPPASDSYWSGSFQYGAAIKSVPRVWTTSTTTYFGYQYDNQSMPTSLPPPPPPSSSGLASSFAMTSALPPRPATLRSTSLNASTPLALDERSMTVQLPLSVQDSRRVRSLMLAPAAAPTAPGPLRLVLDGVHVTSLGKKGGYFYKIYLNLPEQAAAGLPERAYLLGTLGAFEISVAQMQAGMKGTGMQGMPSMHDASEARLVFPATEALRRLWPTQLDALSISFVRVDGARHPVPGRVIQVKSFRVEADPPM
jgi:tyrosinase